MSFVEDYNTLERRFENLKPEFEGTFRDPTLGVESFVVVWNTEAAAGGPLGRCGKGGTRITPNLTLAEVGMLAKIMTLKNAAAGLPLGGAKSGMRDNPDSPGFEQRYRRFVSMVKPTLRENGGIFGGFGFDIGGKPEHALWACDELQSRRSFTGKPLDMGGTDYDREGIAGLGVAVAARELIKKESGAVRSTDTVAIQGLGAMGAAVFRYLTEFGATVKFVSDPMIGGTVRLPDTMSQELIQAISARDYTKLQELLKAEEKYDLDAILYTDAALLVPSAIQDVITSENVNKVRAKWIVEGANNPLSKEARSYLYKQRVAVIPDFIANPGGIIAAFVEMTSSVSPEENMQTRANVLTAKKMTEERITANVHELLGLSSKHAVEPAVVGRFMAYKKIFGTAA